MLAHLQPFQFGLHSTNVLACLIFRADYGQPANLTPHSIRAEQPGALRKCLMYFYVAISSLRGFVQRMVQLLIFINI